MNFARIAVCAAALLTLAAPRAEATRARVTGGVDLRQGPGSGYPVIAIIPIGSIVDVGDCRGRWCTVVWRGWTGYAAARFDLGIPGGSPPGLYPPPGWEYPGYGPYYGPGPYAHYWRRRYW